MRRRQQPSAVRRRSPAAPAFAMAAVATAWGLIPLIVIGVDLEPVRLVAMRVWLGAVVVLAVSRRNPFSSRSGPRTWALGVLLALHWWTFFYAIVHTSVAVALVLVYLAPLGMAAGGRVVLGERVSRGAVAALLVGLLGTVLVVTGTVEAGWQGVAAGVVSAGTLAAMFVIGKPVAAGLGGLGTAAAQLTVAAVVLSPWAIATLARPQALEPRDWLAVAALGVVLTGATAVVNWWAVARLPVATVGVLTYLEPASAVVWAALVLGQAPTPVAIAGVALVVVAGSMGARTVGDPRPRASGAIPA